MAVTSRMSTNIGNFWSNGDLLYIATAVLVIDVIGIFLFRYYPEFFGCVINKWYDNFGLLAVLGDVTILILGFLIARFLYTYFLEKKYGWNPVIFIGLLLLVQLVHDVLFYIGVILPIPKGTNKVIDIFKDYAKEAGANILLADATMMLTSAVLAMAYKSYGSAVTSSIGIFSLYCLSYILFTKPVTSSA